MNPQKTTIAILATLSAVLLALAEDFKTINGKEYKNATVSFIAVKPWNPPDVTIEFHTEHKVSIQLGISAGELGTN
jgi:hypothetical protein